MNVEPDFDRVSHLEKEHNNRRSGFTWVFIIVIGVFLGNVLSFVTYEAYTFWRLQEVVKETNSMLEQQRIKSIEQRKLQEKRNIAHQNELNRQKAIRQKEIESQKAVNAQLAKTCNFWRQQVQRENTAKNRSNRDLACARLNGSFR